MEFFVLAREGKMGCDTGGQDFKEDRSRSTKEVRRMEWNESMAEIPEFRLKTRYEMRAAVERRREVLALLRKNTPTPVRSSDRTTPAQRNEKRLLRKKLDRMAQLKELAKALKRLRVAEAEYNRLHEKLPFPAARRLVTPTGKPSVPIEKIREAVRKHK